MNAKELKDKTDEELQEYYKLIVEEQISRNDKKVKAIPKDQLEAIKVLVKEFKVARKEYDKLYNSTYKKIRTVADKYDIAEYDLIVKAGEKSGYI